MKGFIEVTERAAQHKKQGLNISHIVRFYSYDDYTTMVLNELYSTNGDCSESIYLDVKESYEEIKQLIEEAQS